MKQDADVFCVKYGEKCGLCALQVLFKVCGGFHMQTTTVKKQQTKKSFTSSVYFQFAHGNWVNLRCLHVTSTGKFITGYGCSFTFPPNPCNRVFEINIFNSKRCIFQVIQ